MTIPGGSCGGPLRSNINKPVRVIVRMVIEYVVADSNSLVEHNTMQMSCLMRPVVRAMIWFYMVAS